MATKTVYELLDEDARQGLANFSDPRQEWRRLFSEVLGTFFLVLVAAGGPMMGKAFPDTVSRSAAVTAPGMMVMAIILFMGKVSGAHLNPVVSMEFALRRDFPWRRVPGYVVAQVVGALAAAWFLQVVGVVQGGEPHPRSARCARPAGFGRGHCLTMTVAGTVYLSVESRP